MTDSVAAQAGICQTTINGVDYGTQLLPAFVGLEVGERIYEALVPAIAAAFDGNAEADIFAESSFYTNIAMALVHGQEKVQLLSTVKTLLGGVSVNGVLIDPNNHFRGKFDEMFLVLGWILKENFGSLFTSLFKDYSSQILTLKTMVQKTQEAQMPVESSSE